MKGYDPSSLSHRWIDHGSIFDRAAVDTAQHLPPYIASSNRVTAIFSNYPQVWWRITVRVTFQKRPRRCCWTSLFGWWWGDDLFWMTVVGTHEDVYNYLLRKDQWVLIRQSSPIEFSCLLLVWVGLCKKMGGGNAQKSAMARARKMAENNKANVRYTISFPIIYSISFGTTWSWPHRILVEDWRERRLAAVETWLRPWLPPKVRCWFVQLTLSIF